MGWFVPFPFSLWFERSETPLGGPRSDRGGSGDDRSGHGAVRRVTAAGGAPVGGAVGVEMRAPAGGGTHSGGGRRRAEPRGRRAFGWDNAGRGGIAGAWSESVNANAATRPERRRISG